MKLTFAIQLAWLLAKALAMKAVAGTITLTVIAGILYSIFIGGIYAFERGVHHLRESTRPYFQDLRQQFKEDKTMKSYSEYWMEQAEKRRRAAGYDY